MHSPGIWRTKGAFWLTGKVGRRSPLDVTPKGAVKDPLAERGNDGPPALARLHTIQGGFSSGSSIPPIDDHSDDISHPAPA